MNSTIQALCFGDTVPNLFNINNVPELILYSHLPAAIVATLLAIFLLTRGGLRLPNVILSVSLIFFAYWVFANVLIWGTNRGDVVMFHWSLQILFEPLVYIGMLYLFWVYTTGKNVSFRTAVLVALAYSPLILITPTDYSLAGFNLAECIPEETIYSYYTYVLEVLCIIGITILSVLRYRDIRDSNKRKEVFYLTVGTLFFLLAFESGNVFGSYTGEWVKSQFGLFGMPVFTAFLAYLIVRYKAFDIKLIGAQGLVATQFILIGSMLTFVQSATNYILVGTTLIITLGAGWILIRSVEKEVKRKEELQRLSERLAVANQELKRLDTAKSEFISIASHQLRTPLTAIKGYTSLLLEGSYGTVSAPIQDTLEKIYAINGRLVQLVEDLLSISRIEAGRIQYNFTPTHIEPLVAELVDMFSLTAKEKNLELKMRLPRKVLPQLTIDPSKIKEVISNLIDNALKYTTKGSVTVTVESNENVARIIVSDTGIGIRPEDKRKLFGKFVRTEETMKLFVSGTGLGLYVGKNFVEAHGGKIWTESDGHNQGSRFIIELPLVNPFAKKESLAPFAGSRKE